MSQIQPNIKYLGPVQICRFFAYRQKKMTFFSSLKSLKNFASANFDFYVKKWEKNIGAKILTLSLAVFFWEYNSEVYEIYSPFIEKY